MSEVVSLINLMADTNAEKKNLSKPVPGVDYAAGAVDNIKRFCYRLLHIVKPNNTTLCNSMISRVYLQGLTTGNSRLLR
jgi:hypothetical protein